jgi:hypothetical protein
MTNALATVWLDGQADAIRKLASRSSHDIVEIGQRLNDVKDRLPHGDFAPWIEREFGWSYRTARRFMEVGAAFSDIGQVGQFEASALYALAAESTPAEVRERFVAQAEAGEPVRHRDVKAAITESRQAPPLASSFLVAEQATGEVVGQGAVLRPPITRQRLTDDSPDYDAGDGWAEPDPRERARAEAVEGDRLLSIVGDPNGNIARAKTRYQFAASVTAVRALLLMDTDHVADSLDDGGTQSARWLIRDARDWLDRLEASLGRGIRLVKEGTT